MLSLAMYKSFYRFYVCKPVIGLHYYIYGYNYSKCQPGYNRQCIHNNRSQAGFLNYRGIKIILYPVIQHKQHLASVYKV